MGYRFLLLLPVMLAACDPPPVDRYPSPKGNAPPLLGVIEGSVVYLGPRPSCSRDAGGGVNGLTGRVILTLFAYDNPPPPSGSATTALSVLTIAGDELFATADCAAAGAEPADPEIINRTAAFVWPQIPMAGDYQVRGFWDDDGDFVPFFAVLKSPTPGDVIGAAFVDPTAVPRVPRRVSFGSADDHPQGQTFSGLAVNLAAPVMTEPPLFRLGDGSSPLPSHATLPLNPDPIGWEAELFDLLDLQLSTIEVGRDGYLTALSAAGLELGFSPLRYAWYPRGVDVDQDGADDPHPVLGSAGFSWQYPIVIFSRAQTPAETAAGLPAVTLIAALRPSQLIDQRVFAPEIDLLLPPIAVVDLDPADPTCRIPYVPPLNVTASYEGRAVECQELPTGRYDVSVLHGVAGALPETDVDPTISATGFNLTGGIASGQAWSIPNELGPADAAYDADAVAQLDAALLLSEQGPEGRYLVFDANPDNGVRHDCDTALDPTTSTVRAIIFEAVPAPCCAAISYLCELPLCEPTLAPDDRAIREASGANLSCLPFAMPASCCDG